MHNMITEKFFLPSVLNILFLNYFFFRPVRETHQAIKDWTIANGINDIDFREKIKNVVEHRFNGENDSDVNNDVKHRFNVENDSDDENVEHRLNGENGEKATNGENDGNGENPSKDSN